MKKASIQQWALGPWLSSTKERERHNVTVITVRSRNYGLCSVSSSLSHATLEQPFRTLAIKWEVDIVKEVFLRLSACVCLFIVSLWCYRWRYNRSSSIWTQSKLFWRQIYFRLDLSRCWVALWPTVLSGRGSCRVCLGAWGFSFGFRGPSGRLGKSPGARGAPNKRNADGAVGIFGKCRARVGYGPAPGRTEKKALYHTCP